MMANFDYKHEYFRLQIDLSRRLKQEELRAAYIQSAQDFNKFQGLLVDSKVMGPEALEQTNLQASLRILPHLQAVTLETSLSSKGFAIGMPGSSVIRLNEPAGIQEVNSDDDSDNISPPQVDNDRMT